MEKVKLAPVILVDIEGTTTSISFVKDELFPYARREVEIFLRKRWMDEGIQEIISVIRAQSETDAKEGLLPKPLPTAEDENDEETLIKSLVDNVHWQIDNDRKTTGLKALQGKIWTEGYKDGTLQGHVYEDVPKAIKKWVESGRKMYVYSSGSIEAQKLLFGHSIAGDLNGFFSGNFDTTSGAKVEAVSYINIASAIGVSPTDILFLTDITKEAYAATEAGLQVVVMIRPGNASLTSSELEDFRVARSFEEFQIS